MEKYKKTEWIPEQTLVSASNLNKVENQLENLTNNSINQEQINTKFSEQLETKAEQVDLETVNNRIDSMVQTEVKKTTNELINISSQEFALKLKVGLNLSNSLECWHDSYTTEDSSYWETLWGNTVTTKEMIDNIRDNGFNTVRIPITWRCNLTSNNEIMESWFTRVEEVVNYVLDSGMYCIINLHHDTGEEGVLTAEWDRIYEMEYLLVRRWEEIAKRFAKYDYRLIFEGFNEILNPNCSNLWLGDEDSYKAVNFLNQSFVDTVRKVSGNENRFLLCAPYGAQFQEAPLSAFKMPTDTAKDKLILRVNIYHKSLENLYDSLNYISKYVLARNYTCILTELGFLDSDETTSISGKEKMATAQMTELLKLGIPAILWDCGYDRNTNVWNIPELKPIYTGLPDIISKQSTLLDEQFNFMDINNYRGGEYSYSNGIHTNTTDKVCLNKYVIPKYDKYTVVTPDPEILYMITQHDKDYNFINVVVQGNYGRLDIEDRTKYLGITLYSNSTPYNLENFNDLLNTVDDTFRIIPREDAIQIDVLEKYSKREDMLELIERVKLIEQKLSAYEKN